MFKRPRTDFWQVGIVPCSIDKLDAQTLGALKSDIAWLPDAGPWRYLADPFGIVRGQSLHVFVEAFDYRTKHGVIERHEFERASLKWLGKSLAMARPFHLSYPYVFEHRDELFMIPESHRNNEVAMYRPSADLDNWIKECVLIPDLPVADASVVFHQDRWWMFYSIVGPQARDQKELHAAWAPALTGPWRPVSCNPIRTDQGAARPAGRPFVGSDGCLVLPVQDSIGGYGRAVRLIRFSHLDENRVEGHLLPPRLTGDLVSDVFGEGMHTLSACDDLTLIDVKRVDRSREKQLIDLQRRVRRLLGAPGVASLRAGIQVGSR